MIKEGEYYMAKNKISLYMPERGVVVDIQVSHNQKVIHIKKVNPKKGKILDIASNRLARKNLSLAAYSLYMHFVLNVPDYIEALSVKNITDTCALSSKTYYKAVDELIEKKYLVRDEYNMHFKEYYYFYENPNIKHPTQASKCDES
jgi:hypothetical protein